LRQGVHSSVFFLFFCRKFATLPPKRNGYEDPKATFLGKSRKIASFRGIYSGSNKISLMKFGPKNLQIKILNMK